MGGRDPINCPYFLYLSSQSFFLSLGFYFRVQMKFLWNTVRNVISQPTDLPMCPVSAKRERSSSSVFA